MPICCGPCIGSTLYLRAKLGGRRGRRRAALYSGACLPSFLPFIHSFLKSRGSFTRKSWRSRGRKGGREPRAGTLGPQGPEGRSGQEPAEPGPLGARLSGRHWGAISLPRPLQPRQPSRSAPGRPPLWYHTPPSFPGHLQHPDPRLCAHLGPTGTRLGRANLSGDCVRLRFEGAPPAAGDGGVGTGAGRGRGPKSAHSPATPFTLKTSEARRERS